MIIRTCDKRRYACDDRHHLSWTAKIRQLTLRKINNLGPHADECSVARSLIYVLSLNLYSYYVYASNVGSVKSAHMYACPSIALRCGKYILLIKKAEMDRRCCNQYDCYQLATKARRCTRQLAYGARRYQIMT